MNNGVEMELSFETSSSQFAEALFILTGMLFESLLEDCNNEQQATVD